MVPMVAFLCAIFGVIVVGLVRSHPAALVGTAEPVGVTEALGALLGLLLVGLSVLIRREHVAPRGGVTVLAQLAAGSLGTGWAYYGTNIIVTVVLALAANTSFGGLPVLMSLLSGDNRLPHLFGLRAERPVHRYGVVALAVLAAILLIAVNAVTARLIPLYAIGVFTGLTITQAGLVRHWHSQRTRHWMPPEAGERAAFRAEWDRWNPGVRLDILDSPHPVAGASGRRLRPARQYATSSSAPSPTG